MTDEAHRELDRAICEQIFRVDLGTTPAKLIDTFSSDMTAAWKVHMEVSTWMFSRRKMYYTHIKIIASELAGIRDAVVDYPDVLTLARTNMPEIICRAALLVVRQASQEQTKQKVKR